MSVESKKKSLKYNPFFITFICFALISCLILCALFLVMMYRRDKNAKQDFYQEKAKAILNDFDIQLEDLEDFAGKLVINKKYMYSTVLQSKYSEYDLLDDFKRYRDVSFLTKTMFLYYKNTNYVFRSEGDTVFKNVFFNSLSAETQENLYALLDEPGNDTEILSDANTIYILIPFKADYSLKASKATLGTAISRRALEERFNLVSGQIDGNLALYKGDTLLYCTDPSVDVKSARNAIYVTSLDRGYMLYYAPDKNPIYSLDTLIQTILILVAIFAIVGMAFMFANRVYQPLHEISQKYSGQLPIVDSSEFDNVYDEIEGIVDSAMQTSLAAAVQLEQKQDLYKRHVLRSLLNGTYVDDVQNYLDKLNIQLPGSFYYVISISFPQEISEVFAEQLQKEIKNVASVQDQEYVSTVASLEKQQIWVICSIAERECADELTESIREVVGSYPCAASVGVGNVCEGIRKIQGSWLESMDNLSKDGQPAEKESADSRYNDLQWLSDAFYGGDDEVILSELDKYAQWAHKHNQSYLIQLYTFSEFIGELARLSRSNGITLSKQKISQVVAAKNIDSFYEAARDVLLEYHEKHNALVQSKNNDGEQKICDYIQAHFMDYDLSVDNIAAAMKVQNVDVRAAVRNVTGKKYTDYVTYLRMEHAKKLLAEQKLSVAEICESVGYSSVSYFIRIFKEATGTTPAKYMKEQGAQKENL